MIKIKCPQCDREGGYIKGVGWCCLNIKCFHYIIEEANDEDND